VRLRELIEDIFPRDLGFALHDWDLTRDWDFAKTCRVAALLSVTLWIVSLMCFCYVTDMGSGRVRDDGLGILLSGWAGVIISLDYAFELHRYEGSFIAGLAWLSNVFLALNVIRMWRGRAPRAILAVLGAGLAPLALQPLYPGLFDRDYDVVSMTRPLFGAYVWSASMLPPVLMMLAHWWRLLMKRDNG